MYCGNRSEGRIPEGQAVASDLKAGCYKLVEQLKDTAGQVGAEVCRPE